MRIQCPQCLKWLEAVDSSAGKYGRCPACRTLVAVPTAPTELEQLAAAADAPRATPRRQRGRSRRVVRIICQNPNCQYRGAAEKMPRGSWLVGVLLLLLCFLPGMIYLIFYQGWSLYCPACGMRQSA